MITDFAGDRRNPGFQARNRTVDGEFYLYDGPIGHRTWLHDVNASGDWRMSLFDIDPRTLLDLLDERAEFEVVDVSDGVRHLRATRVGDLPELNFGLGPTETDDVTGLDLWVGEDDLVRRMQMTTAKTETRMVGTGTIIERRPDGGVDKRIDPDQPGTPVTEVHRSSYDVRFSDIGADIDVLAPEDATEVRGQG